MTKKPNIIEVRSRMECVPAFYSSIIEFQEHFNSFFTKSVPKDYWLEAVVTLEINHDRCEDSSSDLTFEVAYSRPETPEEATQRLAAAREDLRIKREDAARRIRWLQEEIKRLDKIAN